MDLARAELLMSRLPVKDRQKNRNVPFALNPNQKIAHAMLSKLYDRTKMLRAIVVKARRVGMSSYIDALGGIHCIAVPQAYAHIVAHLKKTTEGEGLFRVPRDMAKALNRVAPVCNVATKDITYFHSDGDSILDLATAGSPGAGRGLTITWLHLSEAAMFPGADSFLSLIPVVSTAPDTAVVIESTAQGRTGIGMAFYDFWTNSCKGANPAKGIPGRNGYLPMFLSWLNDPDCVMDPDLAPDAPSSDLERELMKKPYNANRSQIAWMRYKLEGECRGQEPLFLQEFPHDASVAFVATGDPAFPKREMAYARSTVKDPIKLGRMIRKSSNSMAFEESSRGSLKLWEEPKPKHHYYIGADAAAGFESGDFAAYVVWNGTTGDQAAALCDTIHPEELASQLDMVGRWYNDAMVNIELTGNLGRWAQKILRDNYIYPNLYIWKGKDDKVPGKYRSSSQGWETTAASRGLMFDAFRQSVRAGIVKGPGGIEIYDEELVRQMDLATFKDGFKWDVDANKGHDDLLVAGMLSVVSMMQYPAPNMLRPQGNVMGVNRIPAFLNPQQSLHHALRSDLRSIFVRAQKKVLVGI